MLQLEKDSWGSRGFLSYRYQKNESKMELYGLSGVPAWNEKLNSLIPTSWTLRETQMPCSLFPRGTLRGEDINTVTQREKSGF